MARYAFYSWLPTSLVIGELVNVAALGNDSTHEYNAHR